VGESLAQAKVASCLQCFDHVIHSLDHMVEPYYQHPFLDELTELHFKTVWLGLYRLPKHLPQFLAPVAHRDPPLWLLLRLTHAHYDLFRTQVNHILVTRCDGPMLCGWSDASATTMREHAQQTNVALQKYHLELVAFGRRGRDDQTLAHCQKVSRMVQL
jgi:hypothetical protein